MKIDFDIVTDKIKSYCVNFQAYSVIDDIHFLTDFNAISCRHALADEMMRLMQLSGINSIPLSNIYALQSAFADTKTEGTFLEISDVAALRHNIENLALAVGFFMSKDSEMFPNLHKISRNVLLFPAVLAKITQILDKTGEIRDNATPELSKIRTAKRHTQQSVLRTLQNILRKAQIDGIVEQDATTAMRDGRLVIPVPAMNKRRMEGIIHDESATGKTSFIEPSAVVHLNNKLRELENDEKREIIKILTEFTTFVRPYYADIEQSTAYLIKIDALCAISKYSLAINAVCPQIIKKPAISWQSARHPVLQELLKKQGKSIVPLDITLTDKKRILIISGPNAGGKSVCIKTIALLQYMFQCGLPVPVEASSQFGIFENIFVDLGDGQDIENDLSTYSSHLQNMKNFLKKSNAKTLIIIDEFGSGTEPNMGGAIAQAILDELSKKNVFALITTHYTNLKHFANDSNNVLNGAMLFDKNKMLPLFVLQIGSPGSSFAIEIARRIGLPQSVVEKAEQLVGSEQLDFDKNFQSAARNKRYWENKRKEIAQKDRKKEQIITEFEQKKQELEQQKNEIILKAKQEANRIVEQANAAVENTIRAIKESKADKEITRKARAELQTAKHTILPTKKENSSAEKLKTGDLVVLKGQNIIGQIVDIKQNTATVVFGSVQTRVKLSELEYVSGNQAKKAVKAKISKQTIEAIREKQLTFNQRIDLRGMRVDEALNAVMYYIDDAKMANVQRVQILHGTGEGALRAAVREYLAARHDIKSFADENIQLGGAGITIVEI